MDTNGIALPILSAALPGTGGRIKTDPAHFVVEEMPLYPAAGSGEHIYVRIEREGQTTRELVRALSRLFSLREADIGTAGLKDKTARTTQTFSLHLHRLDPVEAARRIEAELPVRVLSAERHGNKLRTGHLAGNRFEIMIVEPVPDANMRAAAKWEYLQARAIPNYFGDQRFGRDGDNARRGRDLIRGTSRERVDRWLKRFLESAYQSELFNRWLSERVEAGSFLELLLGDVARRADSGGLFVVADPAYEEPRFIANEIDYTGPIFGKKMTRPTDLPARLEAAILERDGVTPENFARLDGSRRAARLIPDRLEWQCDPEPGGLRLRFSLPPGSYATVVLREFMEGPV